MSDPTLLSKEDKRLLIESVRWLDVELSIDIDGDLRIEVLDDPSVQTYLPPADAVRLRDWLNKVIP